MRKREIMTSYDMYKKGDWVKFYRGGLLVIGQVDYILKDILGNVFLATDIGEVCTEHVLEKR
jgi:hypothetical protein